MIMLCVNINVFTHKILQVNYEARGWVVHHISDIWAKTSPYRGYDDRRDVEYSIWQMGGAWICTHLWEHYTYTMDIVRVFGSVGFIFSFLLNMAKSEYLFLIDILLFIYFSFLLNIFNMFPVKVLSN